MSRELRRFDISFKNPSANFSAGDVVSGTVHIDAGQDIKLKGESGRAHSGGGEEHPSGSVFGG